VKALFFNQVKYHKNDITINSILFLVEQNIFNTFSIENIFLDILKLHLLILIYVFYLIKHQMLNFFLFNLIKCYNFIKIMSIYNQNIFYCFNINFRHSLIHYYSYLI